MSARLRGHSPATWFKATQKCVKLLRKALVFFSCPWPPSVKFLTDPVHEVGSLASQHCDTTARASTSGSVKCVAGTLRWLIGSYGVLVHGADGLPVNPLWTVSFLAFLSAGSHEL